MATRDDTVQAAHETARLGFSTVVEGIATGIVEVGAATPVVAPLCIALLKAKVVVDGARRNEEELKELLQWCNVITEQVIDKAKVSNTSTIDVSPLQTCVDKLNVVADRYHGQGCLSKLKQFRRDGDDIQRLRARIQAVVPIMGLAGVVDLLVRLPLYWIIYSLSIRTAPLSQPQQQTMVNGGSYRPSTFSEWSSFVFRSRFDVFSFRITADPNVEPHAFCAGPSATTTT